MLIFLLLQSHQTPLHLSSADGRIEVVKLLLSSGASKEAQNRVRTLYIAMNCICKITTKYYMKYYYDC